ncbi:NlpC/P60 family protein [Pseudoalteromonas pernae]|uniref:NlpC/P60 family protein n=1 Tax=Pseudoalteromonas pernae TaxID=3118054 RepID=UPI003242C7F5
MTTRKICTLSLVLGWAVASTLSHATDALEPTNGILSQAMHWNEQPYRVGVAEQCMNWTREVLSAACGDKFKTLESQRPWDKHLLGDDDELLPEHADSLASEEFGTKITAIHELHAGDLVFLKNTYGNWAPGVITHVGIALGDGQYIHRMTSNKGIVKIEPIDPQQFDAGLRLNPQLCEK